jgi:alanine racemase
MGIQSYKIKNIAVIIKANALLIKRDDTIQYLVFDSRKIDDPLLSLFFALKSNRDGHVFLKDAYKRGIRNFVVEKNRIHFSDFPDANFLEVDDVLQSLQSLAAYHRTQFKYPVIAIAGSNGKTIVKDWLYQLLSPDFAIVRSPKSFNSQIGVALSLWQMSDDYNLAIIEAGISKPNEMESLQKMINPDIGVLTNIKKAHFENFESKDEKIREKMKLFKNVDLFIYSSEYISEQYSSNIKGNTFTWGKEPECDLTLMDSLRTDAGTQKLIAGYKGQISEIEIPFQDEASTENALICWSVLLALGVEQQVIEERMKSLIAVKMRLEMKDGVNNSSIIDDSYSCDISSLTIALDFLQQQNQHQKRSLILSDIPEIGNNKEKIYKKVAELVENKGIGRFIGVGKEISEFSSLFKPNSKFFPTTSAFLKHLDEFNFQDETILIKGARKFSFETISKALSSKVHDTSLEIDLNALESNLKFYKSHLKAKTKLMVMVKAFSYGSGSFEIANLLQFNQVDYLAVAYVDEGITLRNSGIKLPIMVMSPDLLSLETIVEHKLEPEIFSFQHLHSFINLLNKTEIKHYPIHLKLDSGMHRLGFNPEDLGAMLEVLKGNDKVKIASVFSHLVGSDNPIHDDFSRKQIAILTSFSQALAKELGYQFLTHIANTAAILRFPEAELDMVRLGIGLYGINSFSNQDRKLDTVATLKTVISQIKEVDENDTIGYGRRGKLSSKGKIATVKIGYADGYNRRFGNGVGKMLVNGSLVPTIGDICMDMCMLDISNANVNEGDEVIVFGENPRIEALAQEIGTIPYELLAGISQRVKRIYFYE